MSVDPTKRTALGMSTIAGISKCDAYKSYSVDSDKQHRSKVSQSTGTQRRAIDNAFNGSIFCLAYLKMQTNRSSTNSSSICSIEKFRLLPNPSKPPTKSAIIADASLCINPIVLYKKLKADGSPPAFKVKLIIMDDS